MNTAAKGTAAFFVWVALSAAPAAGVAQTHGGDSGGGCGDVFGDLIHIRRDAATGQPVLAKRWIEYPTAIYDWGYCPIAVDADGNELGFAPLSCDVDPADLERVVELDYFGRLSGGRTKERNNRMHFDEVISNIKMAERLREDPAGRLEFGYDCAPLEGGGVECASWGTTDSPMANLGLYRRLMKYGHFQTDPLEIDTWVHGDPALGTQYHPALAAEDWGKFDENLRHLLPQAPGGAGDCFGAAFPDGFNPACAQAEPHAGEDFVRAGSFLAGAADKTGRITPDLVQYINRILKITLATETTVAALDTLPALILDCGAVAPPPPVGEELPVEPEYPGPCVISDATPDLPWPANELFVDFAATSYRRSAWRDKLLEVLQQVDVDLWRAFDDVPLLDYLEYANGPEPPDPVPAMPGFVSAAGDALRTVEFLHNYAIPIDLGWNDPPTLDPIGDLSILEDAGPQTVDLTGITAGEGDEQALVVTAVSDDPTLIPDPVVTYTSPQATGSLVFTPAPNANGTATITVTVDDQMSKNNTAVRSFVVTIVAVNDAPSFTGGGDVTADRDEGVQSLPAWASAISAGPADEAGQALDFLVSNDNPALFAEQPAIDAAGTLTFAAAAGATGSATVTAALHDDGGTENGGADTSAPQTFQILVTAVNDAPTFTGGGDVTAAEDAGSRSVPGWATAIAAGPPDEAGQGLAFVATNDNPGLFAAQPAIDAAGTLTYTPAPDAHGTAIVTVTLRDDAGWAHGGADTSAPQTFRIVVTPVNDPPVLHAPAAANVVEGGHLAFAVSATDRDGDTIRFGISGAGAGAEIDPATGDFAWTPGCTAAGLYEVTISASDGQDPPLVATASVAILVQEANCRPVIETGGGYVGVEGTALEFTVLAEDPDGDPVTISAGVLPEGASFEPATGTFSWLPRLDQAGEHAVSFSASDPFGGIDAATVLVLVTAPAGPLFSDDFSHATAAGDPCWETVDGAWSGGAGAFAAASVRGDNLARVSRLDPEVLPLGAGVVESRVKLTARHSRSGGPNASVVFGYRDPLRYRWVRLTGSTLSIGQSGDLDGIEPGVKKTVRASFAVGRWHRVRVEIHPDGWVRVSRRSGQTPLLSYRFRTASGPSVVPGGVGLAARRARALFDEIAVWEDSALAP